VCFMVGEIYFLEISGIFRVLSRKKKLMNYFELVGLQFLTAVVTNRSTFCFMLVSLTLKMEATCYTEMSVVLSTYYLALYRFLRNVLFARTSSV
jgi:hypothetical protein